MRVMAVVRRGMGSIAIFVPTIALWLGMSPALAASRVIEHVGPVVSVDSQRDAITIDEMGPWHGPHTRRVRSVYDLTADTKITMLDRRNGPGGPAASAERRIPMVDIRPGDWANLTLTRDGNHLAVTNVEVVRPHSPAPALSEGK